MNDSNNVIIDKLEEKKKKQTKKVTIFAFILSFTAIAILFFGFKLISSDKVVMMQSISNLYNKMTANMDEETSVLDKISSSKNVGIKSDMTVKIGKDKYNLKLNYLENQTKQKSNLDLSVGNGEEDFFSGNLLLSNKKLYMYVEDLMPNYYSVDFDYFYVLRSISGDDLEDVISLFKEALDSSISNKDIDKEKTTIKYEGKDKKVNKLEYVITTKELEDISSKFIKSLKKNKSLLSNISSVLDMSSDELSDSLDNFLKEIHSEKEEKILSYNIYYYGFNKIVQYELYFFDSKESVKYLDEGNRSYFTIDVDNTNVMELEVNKSKSKYTFNGKISSSIDNEVIESKNYTFNGVYEDGSLELNVDDYQIIVKYDKEERELEYIYKANIKIYKVEDGSSSELATIDANTIYYFDKEVSKEVTDAKDLIQNNGYDWTFIEDFYKIFYIF